MKNWKKIDSLGEGGQGKVWLVEKECEIPAENSNKLISLVNGIQRDLAVVSQVPLETRKSAQTSDRVTTAKKKPESAIKSLLAQVLSVQRLIKDWTPEKGAMKELHRPADARDADNARDRFQREVDALKTIDHPNILKLLDVDVSDFSFVSEYHKAGTIADRLGQFAGQPLSALQWIRPAVSALAELHSNGYVHRDLKPENIFLNKGGEPVIGDFGLVIDSDADQRLSQTYENVGSRDWMPGWAQGIRYEDVTPAFDVFSIGKIIWSLVAGKPRLRLWYFDREPFNLLNMHPRSGGMRLINELLARTVVEEENDCLPNATALLEAIDKTIAKLELNSEVLSKNITRTCTVCGEGQYRLKVDGDLSAGKNFGICGAGTQAHRIFVCSYCGHTQVFSCTFTNSGPELPEGWID